MGMSTTEAGGLTSLELRCAPTKLILRVARARAGKGLVSVGAGPLLGLLVPGSLVVLSEEDGGLGSEGEGGGVGRIEHMFIGLPGDECRITVATSKAFGDPMTKFVHFFT